MTPGYIYKWYSRTATVVRSHSIQGLLLTVFKDCYCVGGFRMKERICQASEGKAGRCSKEGNPGVNRVYNMKLMRHRFYVIEFKRLMRVIFSLFFIPSILRENGIKAVNKWLIWLKDSQRRACFDFKWDILCR
jgi:hypothetical protein